MKRTIVLASVLLFGGCKVRSLTVVQEVDDPKQGGGGGDSGGGEGGFRLPGLGGSTGGSPGGAGSGGGGQAGGAGGACVPREEACNGLDDNCDGQIDEGFDLKTDPANCGQCGRACSFPHALPKCEDSKCVPGECLPGYVDADKDPDNGCECLRTNAGIELCDGADNNCDGQIDEGFDFSRDLQHCGGCYKACDFANAAASCDGGTCRMGACMPGFLDINKDPKDGCEYRCTPTNNGVEICDGQDNDCDGKIDNEPMDAGMPCGGKPGGLGECRQGAMACVNGHLVCLGAGTPGPEVCDGKDNDCNGMVDEDDPFVGKDCFPPGRTGCDVSNGTCRAPCKLGKWACAAGRLSCEGAVVAAAEICDGVDNDCNGVVDDGFNKTTDPRHCGACNNKCEYANAIALCENGTCKMGPCNFGWVDANKNPADGCELQCTFEGPEVCDGKDNDCDGLIDTADPDLVYPTTNFCSQVGECGKGPGGAPPRYAGAASFPVCTVPPGGTMPDWVCNYPATVQLIGPNQIAAQESWCDGLDNNCDGRVDEHTTNKVSGACEEPGGLGECRRKGTYKCQADKTLDAICDVTGVPVRTPTHEVCDGLDNDCDGLIDEVWDNPPNMPNLLKCGGEDCRGVRDELVQVGSTYMYRYEASRVDATATSQGASVTRACSRPGVMPWSFVNYSQALAACQSIGMRLCTGPEWETACKGNQSCTSDYFPYACTYDATRCNGADRNLDAATATGVQTMCTTTGSSIFDMSGNLAEWTSDQRGMLGSRRIFLLRGGSFNNHEPALRCDSTLLAFAEDYSFADAGFRCCSPCPGGQAACSGGCVNLGTNNNHCGACSSPCASGKTCKNGRCE
jgi:hypothetical protein